MQVVNLRPFHELRFESTDLKVFITEGILEFLGQELLNERWYTFKNTKGFFYTIKGATLKLDGKIDLFYISKHTNIKPILKYFYKKSKKQEENSENILVLGKGRTSFCTTLINFFTRNKSKVLLTEISPETGALCFSGVMGISLIDKIIEYNKGIDLINSLIYFYGSTNLKEHYEQYKLLLKEIFLKVKNNKNIKEKIKKKIYNFIICPNDLEVINFVKGEMEIHETVVLGDERLFNLVDGEKKYIPNQGYVKSSKMRIREYFYGKNDELTPYNLFTKNFTCFKWSSEVCAPTSALPLGAERRMVVENMEEVESETNLVYGIMEEKGIKPCLGFVIPLEGNRLLAPKNKLMRDVVFFKGDLKYYEG